MTSQGMEECTETSKMARSFTLRYGFIITLVSGFELILILVLHLCSMCCLKVSLLLLSQTAMQSSASSVVLPALEWSAASELLALLNQTLSVSPVPIDPDTLSELQVNPADNNLLFLNLPYCTG